MPNGKSQPVIAFKMKGQKVRLSDFKMMLGLSARASVRRSVCGDYGGSPGSFPLIKGSE